MRAWLLRTSPWRRAGWAEVPGTLLAALVAGLLALMIVPVPTWLLDLLIAGNLAGSMALLLVALGVGQALELATFPTLLVLTTLFRLALNISSTRLILLQADAGEVVRAFGDFVVRGNTVVGAVMFVLLTVVQFVVISRGAERVAEVTARFALDALPGKQMAIDAELRAGLLDGAEARERRRALERESQFHGAMDGAMKFVKGDAVASLVITAVNLIAGFAVGVGQLHLEPLESLQRFTLLTIGDGLVSQLPAVTLATAAALLVTRVSPSERGAPLARDVTSQLTARPQSLRTAAAFVAALALVPGLPALPFLAVAGLLVAASAARPAPRDSATAWPEASRTVPLALSETAALVPALAPWSVQVSADLAGSLDAATGDDGPGREASLRAGLLSARDALFEELGVPLPAPVITLAPELPSRSVSLSVLEVPAAFVRLPASACPREAQERVLEKTLATLRVHAPSLLGIAETQTLLDGLSAHAPALVRQVVPSPLSVTLLTEILRRLVEEQVSVRDLKTILESLAPLATRERDPLALAEHLRSELRRAITHELTGGRGTLEFYALDALLLETLRDALHPSEGGAALALPPRVARDIITAVRRAIDQAPPEPGTPAVLLTPPELRRHVRELLRTELPDLRVVSCANLQPELALLPLATANLRGL